MKDWLLLTLQTASRKRVFHDEKKKKLDRSRERESDHHLFVSFFLSFLLIPLLPVFYGVFVCLFCFVFVFILLLLLLLLPRALTEIVPSAGRRTSNVQRWHRAPLLAEQAASSHEEHGRQQGGVPARPDRGPHSLFCVRRV